MLAMGMCPLPLMVLAMLAAALPTSVSCNGHFLNSFAVEVHGGQETVERVAKELGFIIKRQLPHIGAYVFEHPSVSKRSKRSAENHLQLLKSHPKVRYAQQEVELTRVKRRIIHDKQLELPIREIKDSSVYHRVEMPPLSSRELEEQMSFNDPFYNDMWYLRNRGQSGGEKYIDLNVEVAWASGFTGKGVVVCILDDGVDHTHPDLVANYDPEASADLNDVDDIDGDPMPNKTTPGNSHGTRCAGEVSAAADNDVCGVGIAYNAKIGGIRVLDGRVTDSLEGEALQFKTNYIDIFSASWGPNDDGKTMEAPHHYAAAALQNGVKYGRNGLGNIYVWATGNGGMNGDNCNADGYVSSIETLSVGSINDWGHRPFYMENCTSTIAVVPTGGEEYRGQEVEMGKVKLKVVTTDINGGCIENFQGTSSAAPLAAGCLANVLQANPSLTWRDVQHVVVHGTRIPSVDNSWTINGGGHHISHEFGFGLMDCGKMVQIAQEWSNVPEQHICQHSRHSGQKLEYGGHISDTIYTDGCKEDKSKWIQHLEHVQIYVKLITRRRGDTRIVLTSPSGTRSEVLSKRPKDDFTGEWEFTFMTVHCWDENPDGKWVLDIYDEPAANSPSSSNDGHFIEWKLTLLGTAGDRYGRELSKKVRTRHSFKPSENTVARIKREETEAAINVQVKRASSEKIQKAGESPQSFSSDVDTLFDQLRDLIKEEESKTHEKRVLKQQESSMLSKESHDREFSQPNVNLKSVPHEKKTFLDELLRQLDTISKNPDLGHDKSLKKSQSSRFSEAIKHHKTEDSEEQEVAEDLAKLMHYLKKE
ncbi:PC3-like endoprotease variant B isoform X2 [Pomacea canaliculata]|nr:PC3-like endoprotease variant B isoform X2 [Pomacea canaliculata]XP_025099333.1 PC3-like endoprotease variant B isoform X2 [Pomacea canaliculata]XP_025099334.1 PC3-like endoprotease variant B isoform X2 [Pomacea canaliculata]